jgi:hypothetical protein
MPTTERCGGRLLVLGVAEAEEKADGHGLRVPEIGQRAEVDGLEDAVRPAALAHAVAAFERHERRRVIGAGPVEVGAVLAPQVEQVLEAGGGDECGARPAALEQSIGRDRRAVGEALDVACAERLDGREHRLLLAHRGRHLRRAHAALVDHDGVGECPADVDAEKGHAPDTSRGARPPPRSCTAPRTGPPYSRPSPESALRWRPAPSASTSDGSSRLRRSAGQLSAPAYAPVRVCVDLVSHVAETVQSHGARELLGFARAGDVVTRAGGATWFVVHREPWPTSLRRVRSCTATHGDCTGSER